MLYNQTNKDFLNYTNETKGLPIFFEITSYFGIIIIVLGLIFNTLTFFIFRLNKELKKIPSLLILSFVCISETLSLFTWNLNHFLVRFNTRIEDINIFTCKFFSFMQYSSLEISGLLLSLCSIDRYFTIASKPGSFMSKLPFGTLKTCIITSSSIILFIIFLNSYLLIMNRQTKSDNNFECYTLANGFKIYDTWDKIHPFIYNFIPFVIMTMFNFLLFKKTTFSKRICPTATKKMNFNNRSNKKNLTHTLLTISTVFIIMTLPSSIAYGYLIETYGENPVVVRIFHLLDHLAFLYHTTLFFNCLISNIKFRNCVLNGIRLIKSSI
jgi:hypothetical protein